MAKPKGQGHFTPTDATGQREAARRNRRKAFKARNELISVLARLWPSHLAPITSGPLRTLGVDAEDADHRPRSALCVHPPGSDVLCWVVSAEEVETDFAWMADRTITTSHRDRSSSVVRSERLAKLPVIGDPEGPPHDPLKTAKRQTKTMAPPTPAPLPPRRAGDFSRKRTKGRE